MRNWRYAVVIAGVLSVHGVAGAQGTRGLSDSDRAQIQQLSARYAQTLAACAAADYAGLFAPDGYFESGFRGKVQGTDKLIELVRSERHCTGAGSRPASPAPTAEITPSATGATGVVKLPNDGGAYEDVYVKTADGWKFKARSYWTSKELAARAGQQTSSGGGAR